MGAKWKEWIGSRKFWAAMLLIIGMIANDIFGLNIDPDTLLPIVVTVVGWIVGQGVKDAGVAAANGGK